MGYTVASPCPVFLMGVQTLRASWADCWETASLEDACQESARLGAAFLSMAAFCQSAVRPTGRQKAEIYLDVLRGTVGPDVLKGSGARVRLPVAHYSDISQFRTNLMVSTTQINFGENCRATQFMKHII